MSRVLFSVLFFAFVASGCAVNQSGQSSSVQSSPAILGCAVELSADANGNCCVDNDDYDIMRSNWGMVGITTNNRSMGDFNGDGSVGNLDFSILRASLGTGPGCVSP